MKCETKILVIAATLTMLILAACTPRAQPSGADGTVWGTGAFSTNGERIYFTATSERDTTISYTDGPSSNGWMMGGGRQGHMVCASCHGPAARGGEHNMGMMQVMTAPDIRWSVIGEEFDAELFKLAVTKGEDPNGTELNTNMPRWTISDDDLADLITYLKSLP